MLGYVIKLTLMVTRLKDFKKKKVVNQIKKVYF